MTGDLPAAATARQWLALARRLRWRLRRRIAALPGGELRSLFFGTGLDFAELAPYQAGDDVRAIDWHVTARLGVPFIKRFLEEREWQVVLLADTSGSLDSAVHGQPVRHTLRQLVAFLALVAAEHLARVGLAVFTSRVERWLPPRRGGRHLLRLLHELTHFTPAERGTSIADACRFVARVLRRRALVVLLSDWLAPWPTAEVRRLTARHEVIGVRLLQPLALHLPRTGIVSLRDLESGEMRMIDTSVTQPTPSADWDAFCQQVHMPGVTLTPGAAAVPQLWEFLVRLSRTAERSAAAPPHTSAIDQPACLS